MRIRLRYSDSSKKFSDPKKKNFHGRPKMEKKKPTLIKHVIFLISKFPIRERFIQINYKKLQLNKMNYYPDLLDHGGKEIE
jgi:hypothetical protein